MQTNKTVLVKTLENWLPLAVVIIIFSGLAYVAVQQNYRMSANDPQIQIAEDVAYAIATNQAVPQSIVPTNPTVEITQSLSPFVAMYSATGTPIGSTVLLDGKLPVVSMEVFDKARTGGENRLTWQPKKPGARFAAVVAYFGGKEPGFVLVGRSLKEVEIRESQLIKIVAAAAILSLILTFLTFFFLIGCKFKTTGKTNLEKPVAE